MQAFLFSKRDMVQFSAGLLIFRSCLSLPGTVADPNGLSTYQQNNLNLICANLLLAQLYKINSSYELINTNKI